MAPNDVAYMAVVAPLNSSPHTPICVYSYMAPNGVAYIAVLSVSLSLYPSLSLSHGQTNKKIWDVSQTKTKF